MFTINMTKGVSIMFYYKYGCDSIFKAKVVIKKYIYIMYK